MIRELLILFLLALVIEAITEFIVHAKIIERPRFWLSQWKFFGELLSCGYCTSFWAALSVMLIVQYDLGLLGFIGIKIIRQAFVVIITWRISNFINDAADRWLRILIFEDYEDQTSQSS